MTYTLVQQYTILQVSKGHFSSRLMFSYGKNWLLRAKAIRLGKRVVLRGHTAAGDSMLLVGVVWRGKARDDFQRTVQRPGL